MTAYENEGYPVDRKGYNWHMSARPALTADVVVAGTSVWTLTKTGDIPSGAILIEDATTAGRVNISKGAAAELVVGVATVTRQGNDARPLTYTILGVVELVAGTGGVTKGDLLKADTVEAYWGAAITSADAGATVNGAKATFGKALETALVGAKFMAYVNFMK